MGDFDNKKSLKVSNKPDQNLLSNFLEVYGGLTTAPIYGKDNSHIRVFPISSGLKSKEPRHKPDQNFAQLLQPARSLQGHYDNMISVMIDI
jgi:hypothetical protein